MLNGRNRITASLAALAVAGSIAVGVSASTAPANAEPDVSTVRERVQTLLHQAEQASERYNDARIELADLDEELGSLEADQDRQGKALDGNIEGRSGGRPGTGLETVTWALDCYYVLMPLAIAGAVVLRRRRVTLYPLLAQALLATFTAATTFGVTRYRAGAEVAVVVLAALAVDAVAQRRWPRPLRLPAPVGSEAATASTSSEVRRFATDS